MKMSIHRDSAAGGVWGSPRALALEALRAADVPNLEGTIADLPVDADAANPFSCLVALSKRHARLSEQLEVRARDLTTARRVAIDPHVRHDVALANLDRRRLRYRAALTEVRACRLEAASFLGTLPVETR